MDELFRMITLRQPDAPSAGPISLATTSAFQRGLTANPAGPRTFNNIRNLASAYLAGATFVGDAGKLPSAAALDALFSSLTSQAPAPATLAACDALITKAFGADAATTVATAAFQQDETNTYDAIVALFASPTGDLLSGFVRAARLFAFIRRVAVKDATLSDAASISAALEQTLVLPSPPFPIVPNQILPVGIADLLVIKQHPLRYEPGEISHVENVLSGETRSHDLKHTLTLQQTTLQEEEVTTQTIKDLQTTDQSSLRTESQNALQENVNVQAGVAISASYGSLQLNTNASVAYSNSKSQTTDVATNRAKEVVNRAVTNITDRVRTQQTTSRTEVFVEKDGHSFTNDAKNPNVVGIYQWLNEVYRAQVFNYGKRVLFDVTVPEPAAFLLDAAQAPENTSGAPAEVKEPPALAIGPGDLSPTPGTPNFYGDFVKTYNVVGVPEPPTQTITISKAIAVTKEEDTEQAAELTILEGYGAVEAVVQGMYNHTGNKAESGLAVYVGTTQYLLTAQVEVAGYGNPRPLNWHSEATSIPVAVHTWGASDYAVTIDIKCTLSDNALAAWKNKVYDAILQARQKQLDDYNDSLTQQQFDGPARSPLGGNPDQNRITEQVELKKACLAMLSGMDLLSFNGIKEDPLPGPIPPPPAHAFPRVNWPTTLPVPADVDGQTRLIRFFEQAFEWPEMMYFLYPYFWARKGTWYDRSTIQDTDSLFAQFLSAGAARVVIPVRPGFETLINYFLMTGQVWGGGALPLISDSAYLPITEEIRDASGAPGDEIPVGDPWEIQIPTTLVLLRDDHATPAWEQQPPNEWEWVAVKPQAAP